MKIIITTALILISFGSFAQSIIKQKQPPTVKLILPQQKFENKLRNAGSALVLSGMFAVISGLTGNDKGVTNVLRAGSGVTLVVSGINIQGAVSEYKKIQEQKK